MNDGRQAQAIWFVAALIVPAAFFSLFRVEELRIDAALRQNAQRTDAFARDRAFVQSAPAFERERAALEASLRTVALDAPPTRLVALFIRDAARAAARHHTTVASIAAAAAPAAAPPFEAVALDLTLEGRYADLLATLRELTRSNALAAVDVSAFGRKDAATGGLLVASVHVVLNRLAPTVVPHDRARPA